MKRIISLCLGCLAILASEGISRGTDPNKLIEEEFDALAGDWLEQSGNLKTYQGIKEYCTNRDFRSRVDQTLKSIHHYDSMIISRLIYHDSDDKWDYKEEKKTFKDIYALEDDFSVKHFDKHMSEACDLRRRIAKGDELVEDELGVASKDAQVLILEAELRNYLHKIDKLVLRIDDHLHVLHIKNNSQYE